MALTLTRKTGERIFIGANIVIVVTQARDGAVRLTIEAPRDVPIVRGELLPADDPRRDNDLKK